VFGFRDALYFMVRRDLKVRYAQTILGFGWAVLQPFTQVVVFSIFFGRLAHLDSEGIPYPLFSIAAVVPWTYFSNSTTAGAASLTGSVSIAGKVYFPRLLLPLTPIGAGLIDFGIGIGLLLGVMAVYGMAPTPTALATLPLLVSAAALAALSLSVWLAPLGAKYRDVRYVAPFLLQMLMFVTPVIYTANAVPSSLEPIYALNPMVGVVSGFRSAFLGVGSMPWGAIALSYAVSLILLTTGLTYLRRVERVLADIA
jgi:lipopolysaccharide transport system permease protein